MNKDISSKKLIKAILELKKKENLDKNDKSIKTEI